MSRDRTLKSTHLRPADDSSPVVTPLWRVGSGRLRAWRTDPVRRPTLRSAWSMRSSRAGWPPCRSWYWDPNEW